jgi:hypothetical protein
VEVEWDAVIVAVEVVVVPCRRAAAPSPPAFCRHRLLALGLGTTRLLALAGMDGFHR